MTDVESRYPDLNAAPKKFLVVNLQFLFGSRHVETLIEEAALPEDLSGDTVLISGRESRTITADGARKLVRLLVERNPKDIITTHMSEEHRMAFQNAVFDLHLDVDLAYVEYADIPKDFVE